MTERVAAGGRIRILPREVAERIAAGEVIERPSSAVKELVDNAIDAGARRVTVDLRRGGLDLIRVADDGAGIDGESARLLFRRHATSKLGAAPDLTRIATLGFRGEALASLAAVAHVSVLTCPAGEAIGTRVTATPNGAVRLTRWAREPGTTVEARRLFQPTPARLQFLRDARVESAEVAETLRRYALAHPGVAFTLRFDGRVSVRSTGSGHLTGAIGEVLGEDVATGAVTVPAARAGRLQLGGVVCLPAISRPDRRRLHLSVNGRPVQAADLLAEVEALYRPLLPRGRHPVAVLRIEAPADEVDVNVHPAKLEVRLRHTEEAARALARAVAAVLPQAAPVPAPSTFALAGEQYRLPEGRSPGRRLAERGPSRPEAGGYDAGDGATVGPPLDRDGILGLRLLAQVRESLLLAEDDRGLYLIDQHRAHERIIYERLVAEHAAADHSTQWLLEPAVFEVKPAQVDAVSRRLPALAELGFACERFGGRAFLVRAVPRSAGWHDLAPDVAPLLTEVAGERDDWRDRLLVAVSCRAAIRKGRPLTSAEQRELLRELAGCDNPTICPHGSPIVMAVDHRRIERHFGW